ncbi:MAG TPA: hypothetical protein VNA21_04930, partial [Steroidobacteraceae bacterium]|nr:hypothetical protein [Steroidobacteraceae bacterium]
MSVSNVSEQIKQHEALADRVLAEQVALMCRLTTSPLFASTILGLMFCWLTFEDYGLIPTLTWYGALMLVTLIRWRVAKAYLSQPQPERDVHRWRLMMLLLAAVAGAVWSVPGSLMLPTDREKEIVVTILLIGATASGVGSQAPVRHAYTCLLIPFVLPYAIVQFAMGGERVISGLGMLIYIPVVLV